MTSLKVLRITAAVVATSGFLASSGLVAHAAPFTWHVMPTQTTTTTQVNLTKNQTSANVVNNNPQTAETGSVTVTSKSNHHNDGGSSTSATSGPAGNVSNAAFDVSVSSGGGSSTAGGSDTTDTPSTTTGDTKTTTTSVTGVDNKTALNVINNNAQIAQSGKVTVQGNDNGGSATSGPASNSSTDVIDVTVASN